MDLFQLATQLTDQETCMSYLEDLRWADQPACPRCGTNDVGRKADGDRIGRWNCYQCKSSFNVLSGTVFQNTKVPLPLWLEAIARLVDGNPIPSARKLAQELDVDPKTAGYITKRICRGLSSDDPILQKIHEAWSNPE